MTTDDLLEYVNEHYTIDDLLYELGIDSMRIIKLLQNDILKNRKKLVSGDEYYMEIVE